MFNNAFGDLAKIHRSGQRQLEEMISSSRFYPANGHADAYWISPAGQILPVKLTHIREVLDAPEAYSFSIEELHAYYKKYKEPIGFEGKARQEIMTILIGRGWVRLRYIRKESRWSIECSVLRKRVKENIWAWAVGHLQANKQSRYDIVRITELDRDCRFIEMTLEEMAGSGLIASSKQSGISPLVWVTCSAEFLDLAPVRLKK